MDRRLREILTECIRDLEAGRREIADCLVRYPERADELRLHLSLWSALNAAPKAEPASATQERGQDRLLAALARAERPERRLIPQSFAPAAARLAAVLATLAVIAGGAAGASAAFGGPNVAGDVLDAVGITGGGQGPGEGGINNAPGAAETGKDCASENAAQGSDNASDGPANADAGHGSTDCPAYTDATPHGGGTDNAPGAAETGKDCANENASQGSDNASDGAANADAAHDDADCPANAEHTPSADEIDGTPDAGDRGRQHANPNASDGADISDDRNENAGDHTPGPSADGTPGPPDAPQVPHVLPTQARAPGSLPVGDHP